MRLRTLEYKDIPYMLEWMHDPSINCFFRFNAKDQTEESVKRFVEGSQDDKKNRHFAVVDEMDNYQGTVSLKNIDYENLKAEYAVCFRKEAQGKGYAAFATQAILDYAFNELGLNRVYLNVLVCNLRANTFYQKFGFVYEGCSKEDVLMKGKLIDLNWYRMLKSESRKKCV